jgi:hypothetical protein
MKPVRLAIAAFALAAVSPAIAQEGEPPAPVAAVDLKCGDISTLEAAHAAALVYYIAGYADAQRDAGTPRPPTDTTMVGGITLSAAAILKACTDDPEALVRDVIAANGGSAPPAPAPAESAPPAEETAPAEEPAEPASP